MASRIRTTMVFAVEMTFAFNSQRSQSSSCLLTLAIKRKKQEICRKYLHQEMDEI